MYNKETNREDNKNCVKHTWPRERFEAIRSIGIVTHEQCNNCLAVRVTWKSDEFVNGSWIVVTDERVIEPHLLSL